MQILLVSKEGEFGECRLATQGTGTHPPQPPSPSPSAWALEPGCCCGSVPPKLQTSSGLCVLICILQPTVAFLSQALLGVRGGTSGKEPASQCKRYRRGNGNPRQYSCLENPWTEEPGGLQSVGTLTQAHEIRSKKITW